MEREGEVTRSLFPRKPIAWEHEGSRKEGERKMTRSLLPRPHFAREREEFAKRKKKYNVFPPPSLSHRARTWTMRKWRRKKGYSFPSPSCTYTTRCSFCSDISKWLDSLVSSFPRRSFAGSGARRLSKEKKIRRTGDRLKTDTRDVTISGDDLCSTFHKLWDLVGREPIPS